MNDLSLATRDACEVLLRSHPIGVVPMPDGQYHVLTGVRSWQVYEAFRQRALPVPMVLPVVVHHPHGNPEYDQSKLREIAVVDLIVTGQLLSLHPATAQQQLGGLYELLPPERIPEVIRIRHNDTAPVPAPAPLKRKRGRPRKIST